MNYYYAYCLYLPYMKEVYTIFFFPYYNFCVRVFNKVQYSYLELVLFIQPKHLKGTKSAIQLSLTSQPWGRKPQLATIFSVILFFAVPQKIRWLGWVRLAPSIALSLLSAGGGHGGLHELISNTSKKGISGCMSVKGLIPSYLLNLLCLIQGVRSDSY